MSLTTLATLLDDLGDGNRAVLNEAEPTLGVSELSVDDARAVLRECFDLGWNAHVVDHENTPWDADTISEHFAPFRITIHKPDPGANAVALLTRAGFAQWLAQPQNQQRCLLARLPQPFATQQTCFTPWDEEVPIQPVASTKSPRSLVREYGDFRVVPIDIRPWLLQSDEISLFDDPTFRLWAGMSAMALLRSIPDEIETESGALKFRGPPRLTLLAKGQPADTLMILGREGFLGLQRAQRWVFESDREAEMRHVLLAAELAHAGGLHLQAAECVRGQITAALDAAKIAYQMSLSDLSRDTLKALGDLRKAVTEETAKVTDATRQTIAAVASALVVGIGLIATRIATNVQPIAAIAVMVVALAYVFVVALSGAQFVRLQHRLRIDWQPRLYRFLNSDDYNRMVTSPIKTAEAAFWWAAGVGLGSVITLLAVLICISQQPGPTSQPQASGHTDNAALPRVVAPIKSAPATPVAPNRPPSLSGKISP